MFDIDLIKVYEEAHEASKRWLFRQGPETPKTIVDVVKTQMRDLERSIVHLKMLTVQYKLHQ